MWVWTQCNGGGQGCLERDACRAGELGQVSFSHLCLARVSGQIPKKATWGRACPRCRGHRAEPGTLMDEDHFQSRWGCHLTGSWQADQAGERVFLELVSILTLKREDVPHGWEIIVKAAAPRSRSPTPGSCTQPVWGPTTPEWPGRAGSPRSLEGCSPRLRTLAQKGFCPHFGSR